MLGAITLSLADFGVIAAILTPQIGLLFVMVRSHSSKQERELTSLRGEMQSIGEVFDRDVTTLRSRIEAIEREKADKEAWVRESVSTRMKIDGVAERIAELGGKIDAQGSLAGAMNALARSVSGNGNRS